MPQDSKQLRVLIIDDEPQILESCKSILAPKASPGQAELDSLASSIFELPTEAQNLPQDTFTFDITTANQGLDGVALARQAMAEGNPFAIAFVDMRMPPGIDGLETSNQIIEASPGIEVVIVTAYSDIPLEEMARQLGESRFLLLKKPFDPDELVQMAQFLAYRWQIERLSRAYERFVPKEFLRLLHKDSILDVEIGDHVETQLSVLFADIRSFTTLSEQMNPDENFRFLNSYLGIMGPVIRQHHGVIDKFIGDAIMALFETSADDALESGISMIKALQLYNEGRLNAGYAPIQIGVGINSGKVMLGTLGENQRMEGSVVSDTVNVASRIERLTKRYGLSLIISEALVQQLKAPESHHLRLIDWALVAGRQEKVAVYEVYDTDPEETKALKDGLREELETAIRMFHKADIKESRPLFEAIQSKFPEDPINNLYLTRCQHFEEFGLYEIQE